MAQHDWLAFPCLRALLALVHALPHGRAWAGTRVYRAVAGECELFFPSFHILPLLSQELSNVCLIAPLQVDAALLPSALPLRSSSTLPLFYSPSRSISSTDAALLPSAPPLRSSSTLPLFYSPSRSISSTDAMADKENQGKVAKLEDEKRHYEEQLRRRTEEVEMLKREKARLEKQVRDKEAIAAAKKQ